MIKIGRQVLVIYCCCYQVTAYAQPVNVELKYYSKANHYLGQGKYKLAAKQWHQLSLVFLRSEAKLGNRHMWQYAGLAEALAAMSAEKTNDVIAYQYWADSGRYLMTGGTNWPLVQKQLHQRFETTNTQLSAFMQVNDLTANDSDQWQQDLSILQVWNDKLAVFTFSSPKLGLSSKRHVTAVNQQQPIVNYKGAFQPNKKLSGLGAATFRGNQITPVVINSDINEQQNVQELMMTEITIPETTTEEMLTESVSSEGTVPKAGVPKGVSSRIPAAGLSLPIVIDEPAIEHEPLVDINEIELEINEIEPEINVKPVLTPTPKLTGEPDVKQFQENPLARGNMATIKDENVEALQRRSFAPVIKE